MERLLGDVADASISKPITDAEARKIPYLQAIIKEGLRLNPPVVGLMVSLQHLQHLVLLSY